MPADEAQFVALIATRQAAYRAAPNDMAKGGVRADRRGRICALLRGGAVTDWIGTLETQNSTSDGHGWIEVGLARNLSVGTSNNSFSDMNTHTLIEPTSPLYNAAVALKLHDKVVFSGTFFRDDADCIKEQSLTLDGSLRDPMFLFRFTSICRQ